MVKLLLRRLGEGEARARRGDGERPAGRGWGDERSGAVCGTRTHRGRAKETDAPVGKGIRKESDAASAAWCVVAGECVVGGKGKLAVRKCVLQNRAGIVVVMPLGGRAKNA